MLNRSADWFFTDKKTRPKLTDAQARVWRHYFEKLLKAGIELEYNLPTNRGTCDRQNYVCECVAVFKPEKPMPETSMCFEQCANWKGGSCEIAKNHGCVGIYCSEYKSPCPSCSKYDRGCNSCPELYDIRRDPNHIRGLISKELQPTKFVGEVGEHGIYKVCKDGSLKGDGGIEVATVGRRVEFNTIYEMLRKIIKLCTNSGAYTDERCSVHIHLLASYLSPFSDKDLQGGGLNKEYIKDSISELEQPVPEIILANFHQLIRRYHCALIWMGAAGKSKDHLTRWEKFRKPILPYSAVRRRMPQLVGDVGGASSSKRKYAFMNYEPMKFTSAGDISQFHTEARYLDGLLSPAVITAHTCLIYAIALKAVDISKYGVLHAGNKEYMGKQKEILSYLCNNDGGYDGSRHSETKSIWPFVPDLVDQSKELIRLVKNTLRELSPAEEILNRLAEKPVALRLIEGQSWKQIENDLYPDQGETTELGLSIKKLIDTASICECETPEEWVEGASMQIAEEFEVANSAEKVEKLKESVREYVNRKLANGSLFWNQGVGGYGGL